ncbi:hypothetical protein DFH11DRAFT_1607575 [Phellopilus nigrolimitatus]|nr:hypothetical protein DFH11DRAFT_1607575 [Phellopilus nigrolimitatus]
MPWNTLFYFEIPLAVLYSAFWIARQVLPRSSVFVTHSLLFHSILIFFLSFQICYVLVRITSRQSSITPLEGKNRIKTLQYQLDASISQYADLKAQFDSLKATCALLKADIIEARQFHSTWQQKHLHARSEITRLSWRNLSLSEMLLVERGVISKQKERLWIALNLILLFCQYACLASRRVRFLSVGHVSQQSRFSVLLTSHLTLRQRYLCLEDLCLKTRQSVKSLILRLESEEAVQQTLRLDKTKLSDACHAVAKDCQFYQALAWTFVARYDNLQSDYGQLLVNLDQLKGDFRDFKKDLRQVAAQVQETQDIAEVGLNDLQRAVNLKPVKFKHDLMRVGQGLALVRLSVTELLKEMVVLDDRDAGKPLSPVLNPPCIPGSVEDAVRKLKALFEVKVGELGPGGERHVGPHRAEFSLDNLQEVTLSTASGDEQKDSPMRHVVASLQEIIAKIEGSNARFVSCSSIFGARVKTHFALMSR